jgi:hypothetical protein
MEQEKPKTKINKIGMLVIGVVALVLIGAVATSVYFYRKSNTNPQEDAAKDLANTIKLVGKHIVLPTDEQPTMATVSDPAKLKDQSFFANAKKGDKVLIYADSRKAILYNPETDRVVEVAPINANLGAPAGN